MSNINSGRFERPDERDIRYEPPEELFEILHTLEDEELKELGLQKWSEVKNKEQQEEALWLFPHQWYDHIPEGMEVTTIVQEDSTEEFSKETHSDDIRFGALAYGITKEYDT